MSVTKRPGGLRVRLEHAWYAGGPLSLALWPLSVVFGGGVRLRRALYARGLLPARRVPRPVVVIGNLTVGGSGKTPLTVWLVRWLQAEGLRVGVVSRGYGGRGTPARVTANSTAAEVGDEPLLIARRTGAAVAVDPDRAAAAARLAGEVDVIVADDGLQHYRLARDLEVLVVDGRRRYGNGRLLPAGPLREPQARAEGADFVVANGGEPAPGELAMRLVPGDVVALADGARTPLAAWAGRRVHAVAGIGDPARYFATLRDAGLEPIPHPRADHAPLAPADLAFGDDLPVLMTEKDAVKCAGFADPRLHYLEVDAAFAPEDAERLGRAVLRLLGARGARTGA